jgi:hypothetical protein
VGIVDDLLGHPGLYLGVDRVTGTDTVGASRLVVSPLPGRAGVTLDYEIFNAATPDRVRGHVEHTIVARTHGGGVVMVIGHPHAGSVTVLRETQPGTFELGDEPSPFPMKVVISMPVPGRLRHAWWYGTHEEGPVERDVSELTLTT